MPTTVASRFDPCYISYSCIIHVFWLSMNPDSPDSPGSAALCLKYSTLSLHTCIYSLGYLISSKHIYFSLTMTVSDIRAERQYIGLIGGRPIKLNMMFSTQQN